MKRYFLPLFVLALVAGMPAQTADMQTTTDLPKFILLTREDIAVGKMPIHDQMVRELRDRAIKDGDAYYWIAGHPLTGNGSQHVSITFANNYADTEKAMTTRSKIIAGLLKTSTLREDVPEVHENVNTMVAKLREDLSYNPQQLDIANATSWEVIEYRVSPGHARVMEALDKESIALHKQNQIKEHWVTYEVKYGAPAGTFVVLRALRGLGDLDTDLSAVHKQAFTPEVMQRFEAASEKGVAFERADILMVRPEISRAPQTVMAANPQMWRIDNEPAVMAGKSKSEVQPAAMKQPKR